MWRLRPDVCGHPQVPAVGVRRARADESHADAAGSCRIDERAGRLGHPELASEMPEDVHPGVGPRAVRDERPARTCRRGCAHGRARGARAPSSRRRTDPSAKARRQEPDKRAGRTVPTDPGEHGPIVRPERPAGARAGSGRSRARGLVLGARGGTGTDNSTSSNPPGLTCEFTRLRITRMLEVGPPAATRTRGVRTSAVRHRRHLGSVVATHIPAPRRSANVSANGKSGPSAR